MRVPTAGIVKASPNALITLPTTIRSASLPIAVTFWQWGRHALILPSGALAMIASGPVLPAMSISP